MGYGGNEKDKQTNLNDEMDTPNTDDTIDGTADTSENRDNEAVDSQKAHAASGKIILNLPQRLRGRETLSAFKKAKRDLELWAIAFRLGLGMTTCSTCPGKELAWRASTLQTLLRSPSDDDFCSPQRTVKIMAAQQHQGSYPPPTSNKFATLANAPQNTGYDYPAPSQRPGQPPGPN